MYLQMPSHAVRTLPFFHCVRWYAYHVCWCHSLAFYASLNACLHVHAWVLLASVLSMLQHNEVMDIRFKPIFALRKHHLLLVCHFTCFLVVLLVCLLACLLASLFLCSPCLSCLIALCLFIVLFAFSFHCLSTGFLVFAFACTHIEWGHMELGCNLLGATKKGMDVSMWSGRAAVFTRFRV